MPSKPICTILFMGLLASAALGAETKSADANWAIVTGEKSNVRSGPSAENKIIEVLATYDTFKYLGETSNDYHKIQTKSGKTGWAHGKYIGKSAYVSLDASLAHVRKGPGKSHAIEFDLVQRHYPLKALERSGDYVKVVDWEGDQGWIHESLMSTKRYCIVKGTQANVRSGPGQENDVLFHAEKKVVFKIVTQKDDWVQIEHEDGGKGWVWAPILWGTDVEKEAQTGG